jgi:hypothetical protein|tara:strand:- start:123 stop:485 length:363 start_codon:yes stop_codon:yes gene_type:complete
MPVKSNTPATPKATAPKKRRTRKTSTTAKATPKAVTKKTPVAKVTVTTFKSGKAVSKVTTLKRPSTARLITPQRYFADIQTRWAIHNFEIQELIRDFTKGFEAVQPYHAQAVKTVKAWTV